MFELNTCTPKSKRKYLDFLEDQQIKGKNINIDFADEYIFAIFPEI